MSIEQPLDPQLIEQTKQQIRSLVAEIAQLSKTDVAPGGVLRRVSAAGRLGLGGRGRGRLDAQPRGPTGAAISDQPPGDPAPRERRAPGPARPAALQGPGQRRGDARAAALRAGRRRSARSGDAGRQSHRLPAGPRPAEDRPGNGRPGRDLPAGRGRARARRRAICGS